MCLIISLLACQHPSLQLFHPILRTVLEEGFSPPPTSSPGLKTVVPNRMSPPISDFFAILVIIIFSSFFQYHFTSILAPFWTPTWTQNRSKIHQKSIPRAIWKTSNFFHRFLIEFYWISGSSQPRFSASRSNGKQNFKISPV